MKKISAEQIAIWGDKAIARVLAIFPTVKDVRRDLMNPFIEHIQLRSKYNTRTQEALQKWVARRNGGATKTVNYDLEIEDKELENLYEILKGETPALLEEIRYFDETEHQPREPMRCTVGDYQIFFGGVGAVRYGGRRGNGYVHTRAKDGKFHLKVVISPELSKHFANYAEELAHSRKEQTIHKR